MEKITLTLTVTVEEARAILNVLQAGITDTSPTPSLELPIKPSTDETPVVKPTPGKLVKMPSLGRSQSQIDDFHNQEKERFEAKSEEQLLKEQRAQERLERKQEKEAEEQRKKDEEAAAQAEIEAIQAAVVEDESPKPIPLVKPWEL